jgi:DNA-binding transcriptional ArsR family regulator
MHSDIPRLKADFFKVLGHPVRIRILEVLTQGEQSVSDLQPLIGTEQAHLSQQLGILRRAGLVSSRRKGPMVIYAVADQRVEEILSLSREMLLDILAASASELQSS